MALHVYLNRTAGFRKDDQLSVSWTDPRKEMLLSLHRLSHWIVDVFALAYQCKGSAVPSGFESSFHKGNGNFMGFIQRSLCEGHLCGGELGYF